MLATRMCWLTWSAPMPPVALIAADSLAVQAGQALV
jgi:hypothetical protein